MAKSIKINVTLNVIRTFCNIAFPVFTFAYVSRILDVQGIGMFDYARSIVSYFMLIAQLGISTYGVREIPKVKHDKSKLSNLVAELFCFNVIATVISYILFFGTLMSVEKFDSYRPLLLINGLSIGFCALGLEWMYAALEEYKYTTIRTIVFQIISFALLLLFVKEKSDIYIYAAINVFSSVGSNVLNFIHARNYIESPVVKISNIFRHIKPIFIFWGNNITSTLYLLIGITLLGYLCDNYSVGLYSVSNKICRITISLVVAICPILLSRSSSYIANGRFDEYNNLSRQALCIITLMSVPITVFLFCFSKDIILLFSGDLFLPAVPLSKIMSLLMIIIPVSTFLSMQILIPYGKEGQIFKILFVATLFNAILSLVFIPKYQYTAAGIINVATELLILILYVFLSNKIMPILRVFDKLWHYLIAGMLQLICTLYVYNDSGNSIDFFNLICSAVLGLFVYVVVLALMKDELFLMIVNSIATKINKSNK